MIRVGLIQEQDFRLWVPDYTRRLLVELRVDGRKISVAELDLLFPTQPSSLVQLFLDPVIEIPMSSVK